MPNVVLGLATMNAGMGMPGSTIRELLKFSSAFAKTIIVDGELTEQAREFYNNYDNIEVIDSPWNGSLKQQYNLLLQKLEPRDWWVMLDDDEVPSNTMLSMVTRMKQNLNKDREAFEGIVTCDTRIINTVSTPRVTFFTENGLDYYAGEKIPTSNIQVNDPYAGPRAHMFRITTDLKMASSPAGRHVVPYHGHGHFYFVVPYHIHLKAPELYVYNDCVKAMFDPDIKDPIIHNKYLQVLKDSKISTAKEFLIRTSNGDVSESFKNFALEHHSHGAPEGRLYIWYFNILHPNLNPIPSKNWTTSLKIVLDKFSWRENYIQNKAANTNKVSLSYPASKYPKGIGEITL